MRVVPKIVIVVVAFAYSAFCRKLGASLTQKNQDIFHAYKLRAIPFCSLSSASNFCGHHTSYALNFLNVGSIFCS